jgi:3'(2'), 5'-bisphosphate nucleotidase
MTFDRELRFAVDAVRRASSVTRRVQAASAAGTKEKSDKSPVTVADFAAQAVVARELMKAFPADALVGEEDASALRADAATLESVTAFAGEAAPGATPEQVCDWIDRGNGEPGDRFWTLDPIDGTKGFLRREQYAIALALIENGRVQVAALACPALGPGGALAPESGIVAAALRGQGAFWLPLDDETAARTPLRVSAVREVRDARFVRSVESGHTNLDQLGELAASLGVRAAPVGLDSQAKYAVLAGGHAEVLLRLLSANKPDYRECIWDQAAGSLVVEEAGGRVTDLEGKPVGLGSHSILATNGILHASILDALNG